MPGGGSGGAAMRWRRKVIVKAYSREGMPEAVASAGPGRERDEAAGELLLKAAAVTLPRLKEGSSWQ